VKRPVIVAVGRDRWRDRTLDRSRATCTGTLPSRWSRKVGPSRTS